MAAIGMGRSQMLDETDDGHIKQPARTGQQLPQLAAQQRKLSEMTGSETNVRSLLPQPKPVIGAKHRIPTDGLDPPSKRTSLSGRPADPPVRPRASSITSNSGRSKLGSRPKISSFRAPPVSGHTRIGSGQPAHNYSSVGRPGSRTALSRPGSSAGGYGSASTAGAGPANVIRRQSSTIDIDKQVEQMNKMSEEWSAMKTKVMETSDNTITNQQKFIEIQSDRINDLTKQLSFLNEQNMGLFDKNSALEQDLRDVRSTVTKLTMEVETVGRRGQMRMEEVDHTHRRQVTDLQEHHKHEVATLKEQALAEIANQNRERDAVLLRAQEDLDRFKRETGKVVKELQEQHCAEIADADRRVCERVEVEKAEFGRIADEARAETEKLRQEKISIETEVRALTASLTVERSATDSIRATLAAEQSRAAELMSVNETMRSKIDFLQSDSQAQGTVFADMRDRMDEAIRRAEEAEERLRHEERVRRKLHNQIQELKGNIRVFCRVRPAAPTSDDSAGRLAQLVFPDNSDEGRELVVTGPARETLTGLATPSINSFSFDKVFGPTASNADVFDEISQLVQSALDGYNVCIFCYGQTGSGKTYTMSQPEDGMIARAVQQIWAEKERLRSKGWTHRLTGEFVEVYNEQLNDLLGRPDDLDRKKLEIRHDPTAGRTTILGATTARLDSPDKVHDLLRTANHNRSVAATRSNERSSRSHTVFVLRISGTNESTGDRSDGVLNLVDLAGSERVKSSGVEGARLREAQNINRSLSCLGDVIAALGNGGGSSMMTGYSKPESGSREGSSFVPYRNSKLTYLLQYSLGGNSKTLMFVMISPMYDHLAETLTSLKFATKVHNTHLGPARKPGR